MESSRWRHRGPFLCHGVRFHCHDNRPSTFINRPLQLFRRKPESGGVMGQQQRRNRLFHPHLNIPHSPFQEGEGLCKGLPARGLPRVVSEPCMSMKRRIAYGMPAFPIVRAVDSRLRWNDGGGRRLCARGYFRGNDLSYPKVSAFGNPALRGLWTKIPTRGSRLRGNDE